MAQAAAWYEHPELVKWLCGAGGFAMDERVLAEAAGSGNLELVRWLRDEGCDWSVWACRFAAETGRLQVLQWLRANGCPWDVDTCKFAALNGQMATLRWARENGCPWDVQTRDRAAAELGYTDVFGNLVEENHDAIDDEGNPDDVLASVGDNV